MIEISGEVWKCLYISGPCILAAKLATKQAKPNGQFHVDPNDMNTFIFSKAVRDLPGKIKYIVWGTRYPAYFNELNSSTFCHISCLLCNLGVGWTTSHKLQNMNVKTCGDMQRIGLSSLQKEFGPKTGLSLYRACRGQDDRVIKVEKERKSVSAEINYGIRFSKVRRKHYMQTEVIKKRSWQLKSWFHHDHIWVPSMLLAWFYLRHL